MSEIIPSFRSSVLSTLSNLRMEDPKIRIIGDVHNSIQYYQYLAQNAPYSLAVGDMGLCPGDITLDPKYHRVVAGNHEIYDPHHPSYYKNFSVFLDDWGTHNVPGLPPIFYVRGAWSIDWKIRSAEKPPTWWPEEELSVAVLEKTIQAYCELKPEIVVSHDAPLNVMNFVTDPQFVQRFGYSQSVIKSKTNQALQVMWENHKPRLWVFGHFHVRKEFEMERTKFVCLDMIRGGKRNLHNSFIDIYSESMEW